MMKDVVFISSSGIIVGVLVNGLLYEGSYVTNGLRQSLKETEDALAIKDRQVKEAIGLIREAYDLVKEKDEELQDLRERMDTINKLSA